MKPLFERWKRFLSESKGDTIVAIFGPSGSGKSRQKNVFKKHGWEEIVSYVTRPPRGEEDIEYEFATEEEWEKQRRKGNLINTNRYGGNFYGTKISDFRNAKKAVLVTDISNINDSRGPFDLKKVADKEGKRLILVFSAPPEKKELELRHKERLKSGEYSSEEEYEMRRKKAKAEAENMKSNVQGISTEVYTIYNDEDAERLARELA
tara:strand:- start:1853 stop:2473 length:621 start_codon:yes stop_codon:yes gene_type:complete